MLFYMLKLSCEINYKNLIIKYPPIQIITIKYSPNPNEWEKGLKIFVGKSEPIESFMALVFCPAGHD